MMIPFGGGPLPEGLPKGGPVLPQGRSDARMQVITDARGICYQLISEKMLDRDQLDSLTQGWSPEGDSTGVLERVLRTLDADIPHDIKLGALAEFCFAFGYRLKLDVEPIKE